MIKFKKISSKEDFKKELFKKEVDICPKCNNSKNIHKWNNGYYYLIFCPKCEHEWSESIKEYERKILVR